VAKSKILVSLVTALYLSSSAQTYANDGAAVVGGMLGLFGAVIANDIQQKNQRELERQQYQQQDQQRRAELIAARVEIQRRLNDMGFNAGYSDGIYGPQRSFGNSTPAAV
jgi:hypothetical protein